MLMPTELTAVDELLKKWAAKVVIPGIPQKELRRYCVARTL
jgi:hypothetical protein